MTSRLEQLRLRRRKRWASCLCAIALLFALARCGDSGTDAGNVGLVLVSGGGQTGEAGATLPQPVVVTARDPLLGNTAGVRVRAIPSHSGDVQPSEATTDAAGRASFTWTLGPSTGAQVLTVEKVDAVGVMTVQATATQALVSTVTVTPAPAEIVQNATQQFTATLRDARGAALSGRAVVWSSSNPTVASVNSTTGVATAHTVGATDIIATSESRAGSSRLTVVATQPTQLVITTPPGGAASGQNLTVQPVIEVRDVTGTVVSGSAAQVTASIASGNGTLGGTVTVSAVNGIARFTDLRITGSGNHTLRFSSGSLAVATSPVFDVVSVTITTSSLPNGQRGSVYSQQLNATGGTGTFSWSLVTGTPPSGITLGANGVLSGTPTITGRADFTVRASSGGASDTRALSITVDEPAASNLTLAFTTNPEASAVAGSVLSPVTVVARDGSGAIATTFTGTITLSLSGSPPSTPLGGTTTLTAVAGVATFSDLFVNTAGTYRLIATGGGASPPASATGSDFVITAGAPALVTIASGNSQIGSTGADLTQPIVVRVTDANGNVAGGVQVQFAVATGGGSVTNASVFTNASGLAQTTWRLGATVGAQTVTATVQGLTPVTFTATGVVSTTPSLAVITQPSGAVSGAAFGTQPVVEVRDGTGARITTSTVAVTATLTSGTGVLLGTATVNAVAGVATFTNLRIDIAGAKQLTFTATNTNAALSASFTVVAGAATQLAITRQPAGATPGAAFATQPQLEVRDAAGNLVTTSTILVTATLSSGTGPLQGTAAVNAVAGVVTFTNLRIDATGNKQITFGGSGLTSATSSTFAVAAGTATQLAVTTQPAGATSGAAFGTQPVVEVRDANGNIVTSSTVSVTVSITSGTGTLLGTTSVNAVAGIATFSNLRIDASGAKQLTFASSGLTSAVSSSFAVAAGAATQLAFTVQPSNALVGAVITPSIQVTARDAAGNTATSFASNVTLAIGTNAGGATLGGTLTAAASAGVASFGNITLSAAGNGYTLTAASGGLTGATSSTFNITSSVGAATQLAVTTQPAGATSGAVFGTQPVVQVRDANSNLVTSSTIAVTATLTTGTGTLVGTATVNAVGGVATFTNLRIDAAGSKQLTFAASGLTSAVSSSFTVAAGAATQLAFTVEPSNTAINTAISPAPQVTARDAAGNTVTSFTSNVTMVIGTNPGGATIGGTTTVAAVAGVATFSNVTLSATGTGYRLSAGSGGLTAATSATFDITGAGSTINSWINASGGNWNTATNWSLGHVPTSTETASITASGTYTVTNNGSGNTVAAIVLGGASGTQTLSSAGVGLTVSGDITVASSGHFSMNSGSLTSSGTIVNSGTVTLQSVSVAVNISNQGLLITKGSMSISGTLTTTAGSTFRVQSDDPCFCNSDVSVTNGFTNNGLLELTTSGFTAWNVSLSTPSALLTNSATGTIAIQAGAGGSRSLAAGQLQNAGTMTVAQSLSFQAPGGLVNTGTLTINAGKSLSTTNSNFTHSTGATLNGGGALSIFGATTSTFDAAFTLSALTMTSCNTVSFATALSSATTAININAVSVSAPSITNAAGQTMTLFGTTVSAPIANAGTLKLKGTTVLNGTVTTSTGSTLRMEGDVSFTHAFATIANGFTNNGTIELARIPSSQAGASLTISNGTLISAAVGSITADPDGNGGTYQINGRVDNGGAITLSAPLTIVGSTFTNTGSINVNGGDLFVGATTVTNSGAISIGGGWTATIDVNGGSGSSFNHQAAGTISGSGNLSIQGYTTATITGVVTVSGFQALGGGTISFAAAVSTAGFSSFVLRSITASAPSFTNAVGKMLDLRATTLNAPLTNSGTLIVKGTTSVNGTYTANSGSTLQLLGDVTHGNSIATFANGFTNNGTIEMTSTSSVFAVLGVASGTLTNTGTISVVGAFGSGRSIQAALNNQGTLDLSGSAGSLSINSLSNTGSINMRIGGTTAGSTYDQITVGGGATLGGTLNVSLINGFVPTSGQSFTILSLDGGRTGTFTTLNLPSSMTPQYNASSVVLVKP